MDYKSLSRYLSNLDKNTYLVKELPEELIATLFAYVSRSSKSLREDILTVTEEKSQAFHEKWVINYGHASIAEMAVLHIGIEKVSRFFTSFLERSNPHASFIEYSQRYQKVKKGFYYTPSFLLDKENKELYKTYTQFQDKLFEYYEELIQIFIQEILSNKEDSHTKKAYQSAEKKAYEDARYILSLAYYSNLAMTVNARALEDILTHLLSSPYEEMNLRALDIQKESSKELKTLIKYAKKKSFLASYFSLKNPFDSEESPDFKQMNESTKRIYLLKDFFLEDKKTNPEAILNKILASLFYQRSSLSFKDLEKKFESKKLDQKKEIFNQIFKDFEYHDIIPKVFDSMQYLFEINVSETCWHQLLRHRKIHFIEKDPSPMAGFFLPEIAQKINKAEFLYKEMHEQSMNLFYEFKKQEKNIENYLILNMHKRKILCQISMKEIYHLIRLRLSPNSQKEFRLLIKDMIEILYPQYQLILEPVIQSLENFYPKDRFIQDFLKRIREEKT